MRSIMVRSTDTAGDGNGFLFIAPGGGTYTSVAPVETQAQWAATRNTTFSHMSGQTRGASGGGGVKIELFSRKNGADGSQLATRTGEGFFTDSTNTDVLVKDDLFNYRCSSASATRWDMAWYTSNIEFDSGHGSYHLNSNNAGNVADVNSATRYFALDGVLANDGTTTEANAQSLNRAYSNFDTLQVRIIANARITDSVFKNRINGADGTAVITVGAGLTGLFQATSLTDTLADGDFYNASIVLLGGVEDLSMSFIGATLLSSSNKCEVVVGVDKARAAGATLHYVPLGGAQLIPATSTPTEAEARLIPNFRGTASRLRCFVSPNSYTTDATLKLFKNGVEAMTTTITAALSGWIENTVDTVAFVSADTLSYEITGGTSGNLTFKRIMLTLETSAAAQSFGVFRPSPMNGLGGGGRMVTNILYEAS